MNRGMIHDGISIPLIVSIDVLAFAAHVLCLLECTGSPLLLCHRGGTASIPINASYLKSPAFEHQL
jgi:hypothetical protein